MEGPDDVGDNGEDYEEDDDDDGDHDVSFDHLCGFLGEEGGFVGRRIGEALVAEFGLGLEVGLKMEMLERVLYSCA